MTSSSESTFEMVCDALGFSESPDFIRKEAPPTTLEQQRIWIEAIKKFGIDAIFFIKKDSNKMAIPFIYFKKMDKYDVDNLIKLHKNIWNQGKIPLLFVILPGQIKIYNCFEPPLLFKDEAFDSEKRLIKFLEILIDAEHIRRELSSYTCAKLSSGTFWREQKDKFNFNNRADQHLLRNLRILRKKIKDAGLEDKIIHRLIGRSIFILCLQDRGALDDFLRNFESGLYSKFTDILKNKEHTYKFFKFISEHFNGDIYPITKEETQVVSDIHLKLLRFWLEGTDLETGQTILWPYRFDIIPIEFISNIYEEFFHYEKTQKENIKKISTKNWVGTYYTPQFLVDFMLDEVLSFNEINLKVKVLDPACGSGIFLVETYRRLIELRKKDCGKEKIEINELKQILQNSIYGVDINREAISITAFSLYLTMIDYIEPEFMWQNKGLFPKLINMNLFPSDFFDSFAPFNSMKFDIIIGNIPWKSINIESGSKALSYCKYNYKIIGDRQIAQAFLWKSLDLCKDSGKICLIISAKSLLFNRSKKNRQFRHQFLENSEIKTIINLSALRHHLFNKSVGPAAIVYYRKKTNLTKEPQKPILYIVPKPSWEIKYLGAIIIDQSDYKRIPIDLALEDDSIWKITMWGTPRDMTLINKASSMGTLGEIARKKGWEIGDGFQRGGGDQNYAPWMIKFPFIPTKSLDRFYIPERSLKENTNTIFHRPRNKKRYTSPLCLIKVTLKKGQIVSTYSDFDVAYTDGIIGISGDDKDKDLLKIICCYINSKLARYFIFLTCSVWGVERDDILKSDLLNLPLVLPERDSTEYKELLSLYDEMKYVLKNKKFLDKSKLLYQKIDSILFNLFKLNNIEKNLVLDTVNYTIDFFQKRESSHATLPVNDKVLIEYIKNSFILLNAVVVGIDKYFNSNIYSGSNELKIVSFMLQTESGENIIKVVRDNLELNKILDYLSSYIIEEGYTNIYLQRIIRIFNGNTIYLIKPNEKRYWTKIAAYKDTDDTIAEILESWREEKLT